MTDRPPVGVVRWLLRAPIPLYRAGWGRLFGYRLVYLAHRGRVSGLRREVVVEVVRHRVEVPEIVVVAAWGGKPQWYRNLRVAAPIEVRCGRYRWNRPERRFLSTAELDEVLRGYRAQHPRAWARLGPRLGFPAEPSDPRWADAVGRVHGVAFSPAR
ncbi:nitroreductase family deazaflavin-dependent oxidoreductase [Amycolatopsis jiangsuensis]|uniref:Deazaflavin-dependent oxidoreductase (Nitroreductase family) n=1 Tax=Amycolatopsis jiangsuensis TaxID=1181879 RepID=A0A840IVN6_9PSEU|nr:nitroreductase family deazaflavin-dependent oxidoreductase [Amycolatopsis jiangsuensis]MBB4685495.1 deazaflavin-dependent oxidoreductase (nitroreductase family) [Amycolatopsis jiangsuensis]